MTRIITQQDYQYKTNPFAHQHEAFMRCRSVPEYALLMEMGTGKTKVAIDKAAYQYSRGEINFLLVSAPNEVHKNWVYREIPTHLPDYTNWRAAAWSSNMRKSDMDAYLSLWDPNYEGLRILAVNHDAFSVPQKYWRQKRGGPIKFGSEVEKILRYFKVMFVVDESSKIKTPGAKRTRRMTTLAKNAVNRLIMTGTPVTNSPLDLYAQCKFLGEDLLGFGNFYSFKHHYAEWTREKNWQTDEEYEVLSGYKNLDELVAKLDTFSYRVTKRECLDLPEKTYKRWLVPMKAEQQKLYTKLKKESILELRNEEFKVSNVLVKMLRLQQIVGGWLPTLDPLDVGSTTPIFKKPADNPRLAAVLEIAETTDAKIIIWARFRSEIKAITAALNDIYGKGKAVPFYGEVKGEDRSLAIDRFQGERPVIKDGVRVGVEPLPVDEQARFFVAQQHSGGYGLTLTAASYVIYYSNDFSLEARLQSEDRCHRIGQRNPVTYIDLEMMGTVDTAIITALRDKKKLADIITRDNFSEWL